MVFILAGCDCFDPGFVDLDAIDVVTRAFVSRYHHVVQVWEIDEPYVNLLIMVDGARDALIGWVGSDPNAATGT